MLPKYLNILYVVVGFLLVATGLPQILEGGSILLFVSTICGAVMVVIGIFGLLKGKVY